MAFTFSTALANYNDRRYDIIRNLEEPGGVPHLEVYVDSSMYATVGAGFKVDSWVTAILTNMSLPGVGATGTNFTKARDAITAATKGKTFASAAAAQTAINDAMNTALGLTGAARLGFAFSSNTQVRNTFDAIAETFETQVRNWFGGVVPEDREHIALLSLAYNNIVGERRDAAGNFLGWKSPNLRQAMIDGDRAEAWFQIRYDSNGGASQRVGIAKRRFYESSLFGLSADLSNPTVPEAQGAYQLLTRKRSEIMAYEALWGLNPDGTVGSIKDGNGRTGLQAVTADYAGILLDANLSGSNTATLQNQFSLLKTTLLTDLRTSNADLVVNLQDAQWLSTNIYLNGNTGGRLDSLKYQTGNFQTNGAQDQMIGGSGADTLKGNKGNDLLIGNSYKWSATSWAADGTLINGLAAPDFSDVIYGGNGNDHAWGGMGRHGG